MRRTVAAGTTMLTLIFAMGGLAGTAWARPERAVCPGPAAAGSARCLAHVITDNHGTPTTSSLPPGYGPLQFHGAYELPSGTSSTSAIQTIAIVDAYDDPTIVKDLETYENTYGKSVVSKLPLCGASNGGPPVLGTEPSKACFAKVNQSGGTSPLPSKSSSWALEIALDVETAHEICQNCNVVLVEANTSSGANLDAAEETAAKLPATEISNSWGTEGEYSGETIENAYFNHPKIAVTVASGDKGYEHFGFPAASPYVIDAGGTTLNVTYNNGVYSYASEEAWKGSGSGCSKVFNGQPWQIGGEGLKEALNWSFTGCESKRGVADVAADADPNTGAAVYDSTKYFGRSGWFQVGGTSLASPLIAGVYALAGNAESVSYPAALPYNNLSAYGYKSSSSALHDVTGGSTGSCGTTACKAGEGYDGPTGVGTPKGTAGF